VAAEDGRAPLQLARRLEKLNRLPRARGPYAIDSGGFTELSKYGAWAITVDRYIAEVRRCADWTLATLREKLVKIGAKVVAHAKYLTFQLAEVAVPRKLFTRILKRIARLRPACASG